MYPMLKNLHVLFVTLSAAGFLLRSFWMLTGSGMLRHPLTRRLPHVIDTSLLITAIGMMAMLSQYPFVAGWLTAKVLGLLVYIVLGAIALTYGRTRAVRTSALVGALLAFAWIVSVAITKNPWGFLA
ncbi:MAG: SirB2 family protein [Rhodocyclaceae bacterium]|jgi:uncharacterized membrane protein SirB2|nr:SirB2 family protein [Rhodocyclaceae bacterium]MCL4757000.1 SirB2 family protein [Rhodocyclaceae bacterium]